MKIAIIAGARPNFMKILPLCRELDRKKIAYSFINTGQHFDKEMSEIFFDEFKIKPDYTLKPSRISSVRQFADIMIGLEKIFLKEKPNLVIVVGDVNSTLAGALTAAKLGIKLAHIESGLRSYNDKMPEEKNRILTDHLSDYLFVTMDEGLKNLKKEGLSKNIYMVGNIIIDTLKMFLPKIADADNSNGQFFFCTLHRTENVDNKKILKEILSALNVIAKDAPIYFPLHPRTKIMSQKFGLYLKMKKIFKLLPPLNYREALYYQKNAKLVLTDSGGIQEEASFLGTPCLTLRTETERPVTVKLGTNSIAGITRDSILKAYGAKNLSKKKIQIPLWDGKAAKRIVKIISNITN